MRAVPARRRSAAGCDWRSNRPHERRRLHRLLREGARARKKQRREESYETRREEKGCQKTMTMQDPRYPVGKFKPVPNPDAEVRRQSIADLSALPARIREAVKGLSDAQIDTPYRDGGWTV